MNNTCPICIKTMRNNNNKKTLRCGHTYCKKCIDRWYDTSIESPTCAVCRRTILKENSPSFDNQIIKNIIIKSRIDIDPKAAIIASKIMGGKRPLFYEVLKYITGGTNSKKSILQQISNLNNKNKEYIKNLVEELLKSTNIQKIV